MPPVGFEPTISAGQRPQTYALDRAATLNKEEAIARVGPQDQRPKKKKIHFAQKVKTEVCYSKSVRRSMPRCIKGSIFVVMLVAGLKCICVELWP